jgi:hypothetical protein
MTFVLVMTLWSLGKLSLVNFRTMEGLDIRFFNGLAALALIVLALYVAVTALLKLRTERGRGMTAAPDIAGS